MLVWTKNFFLKAYGCSSFHDGGEIWVSPFFFFLTSCYILLFSLLRSKKKKQISDASYCSYLLFAFSTVHVRMVYILAYE